MSSLNDLLLTGLLNYGSALLGGTLFLAALGLPLPATMLLLAAGAFSQQGVVDVQSCSLAATAGAIAGDGCSYLLGRYGLGRLAQLPGLAAVHGTLAPHSRASRIFSRWAGWSVLLTRFALTPLALPVNLLAGSTRYPWARFMGVVVLGECLWVAIFFGLGRLFAQQWESLSQLATDITGVLVGVLLVVAAWLAWRTQRRPKRPAAH
jgi:membrane protein DedA with SNARE-associated domain